MKPYHTYSAIEVAFCLLKHAARAGKRLNTLQVQKLTYVCHGWSLALYKRPLITEDVMATQHGPMVTSIHFRFEQFGNKIISQEQLVELDAESDQIAFDIICILGDFNGPELKELTQRTGSPWKQVWDGTKIKPIPDEIIARHYSKIKNKGHAYSL